jgi:hypothetical protein
MNLIHHIDQPNRLLLVWQSPEGKSRMRFVVGEVCLDENEYVFRYLINTEDYNNARDEGFVCYPAFRRTNLEYRESVLETFLRRLPPRKRGDFSKYLQQWRLTPEIDISDFALLGHTGAKLPNDGFSLINPFDNIDAPHEFYIEVAGFRHQEGVSLHDIEEGMSVNFVPEPDNLKDQYAIRIEAAGRKIGYVNKVQCAAFNRWIQRFAITACIERINGTQERPLIYVYGCVNSVEKVKAAA